ncbi:cytochrome P450 [Pseudoalteromonas sp. SMS1]|uniref:cytochrome P450 n=1 Tax=Pseudoalteromonas sp. SMS1 TaxID=2908894 RepID=UPI001F2911FF|nr:cytochrome P450 [Pseudoalteromonas sp. SMS1]MCF2859829.1 cytochrome P450 [Pseudoalteromonas sp. SMS1]
MKVAESDFKYSDPFKALDEVLQHSPARIEFDDDHLYLTDFESSKDVMTNAHGDYQAQSDFFNVKGNMFGSRATQIAISKEGILNIRRHYDTNKVAIISEFQKSLEQGERWPDCANRLLYDAFYPVLVNHRLSPQLKKILDQVLIHSVYSGKKANGMNFRRLILGWRTHRALKKAFATRKDSKARAPEQRDIIDTLIVHTDCSAQPHELATLFLSFFFAINSSVAFTLAWSLYFCAKDGGIKYPTSWIVKEALRLWPVAWNLARFPKRDHELDGHQVKEDDIVSVCPYALHRHPQNWSAPDTFDPQRWQSIKGDSAPFMPFGWGEHKCIAAAFAVGFCADLLDSIKDRQLHFESFADRPFAEAAVAPPAFSVNFVS